jgi:AMMECR1 domain-containing protein
MSRPGVPPLTEAQRSDLLAYARQVASHALGLATELPRPPDCPQAGAGAFVAVRRGGAPCGFFGSIETRSLADAVADAARRAATEDARFDPSALEGPLSVSVWLTGPARQVTGPEELSENDGASVAEGLNRAVHLPGLPGIGGGPVGVLSSACVAADLHPKAWRRPSVTIVAFPAMRLDVPAGTP